MSAQLFISNMFSARNYLQKGKNQQLISIRTLPPPDIQRLPAVGEANENKQSQAAENEENTRTIADTKAAAIQSGLDPPGSPKNYHQNMKKDIKFLSMF